MEGRVSGSRIRNARGIRSRVLTKKREAENEVQMDINAPLDKNLSEILKNVVQSSPSSKKYLNYLVELAPKILHSHHVSDGKMGSWTLLSIYRCLRLLLTDESTEIRAETLRVIRHLTVTEATFDIMNQALLPPMIVRSLDIVLDNRVERLQALRLMRRISAVAPQKFPVEFVHSILAVANDGSQEHDNFIKACIATAAELCISNPKLWLSCDTFRTLSRSLLSTCGEARAAESLVITLMYLINEPSTRCMINANIFLEYFIAPFSDKLFQVHPEISLDHQERERIVTSARQALCSILRSWPGLIYLCSEQSGLTKLIELLRIPDIETQRSIMGLFFDLFCLQTPEWTTDFRIALLATDDKTGLQRGWLLYEGFVAAEGCDILPSVCKTVNLQSCYMGILLLAMVSHGLLHSVAAATVSDDTQVSIHATVLLAELLHLCNKYFPYDAGHMCHLLPGLVEATMSSDMSIRLKAISVINRLAYIDQFKFQTMGVPTTLNLEQVLMFAREAKGKCRDEGATNTPPRMDTSSLGRRKKNAKKVSTTLSTVDQMINNSGVLTNENNQYDWDVVKCALRLPDFIDSQYSKKFLEKLVAFFLPSNRQFSAIETEREQAKNMCSALLAFTDFLLTNHGTSHYLHEIINDICSCLQQIQGENIPPNSVLSPSKASSTLSQAYFLLIGRLTGCSAGLVILKKATIFDQLMKLLTGNPQNYNSMNHSDVYIKLALSALNYTVPGPPRSLFKHVIISNRNESARIYCVNLLRMLIRCKLPDLSRWCIEILTECLVDQCIAVKLNAYQVLNDACDVVENLDSLISLDPVLKSEADDHAWMLLVRYFSRPEGIANLEAKGILDKEIDRWITLGSIKYVKWVEDTINQSVSRHRRNADGRYERRSGEHKLHRLKTAFCPPHLLGQLVAHDKGIEIIKSRNMVGPLCDTIRNAHIDTPTCVFYVKAALWGIGHLCKTPAGLALVQEKNIIEKIVHLAKSANVFGVRGTAFYTLCLISVTNDGCDVLSALGWQGVRQSVPSPDLYGHPRTSSKDSNWSLDSSWTSVNEMRDRSSSLRDSISFDEISNASIDVGESSSSLSQFSANNTWSMNDMRRLVNSYTSHVDAAGYGTLKLLRPKRRYRSTGEPTSANVTQLSEDSAIMVPSVLIGLVLPTHISSIFNNDFKQERTPLELGPPVESFMAGHLRKKCLHCGDCDSDVIPARTEIIRSPASSSKDSPTGVVKVTEADIVQARNDLLKHVVSLSTVYLNSNKQTELSLLSMKQKQPWVFNDLCMYSDLCHLLRIYRLKLPFRKFLQELFLDVNFSALRKRAEKEVTCATALAINAASETIKEDNEEDLDKDGLTDEAKETDSGVSDSTGQLHSDPESTTGTMISKPNCINVYLDKFKKDGETEEIKDGAVVVIDDRVQERAIN